MGRQAFRALRANTNAAGARSVEPENRKKYSDSATRRNNASCHVRVFLTAALFKLRSWRICETLDVSPFRLNHELSRFPIDHVACSYLLLYNRLYVTIVSLQPSDAWVDWRLEIGECNISAPATADQLLGALRKPASLVRCTLVVGFILVRCCFEIQRVGWKVFSSKNNVNYYLLLQTTSFFCCG
jgi:hypothetical protein